MIDALDDLTAENERLRHELALATATEPIGSRATFYTKAVIALAALGVAAILAVFAIRPDKDNTAIIAVILGFLVPVVTALLAAAVQQVHVAVNSRLSQLLLVSKQASRAEGKLAANQESRTRQDATTLRHEESAIVAKAVVVAAQLAAAPSVPEPVPVVVVNTPLATRITEP